jgi:hypothetical protein
LETATCATELIVIRSLEPIRRRGGTLESTRRSGSLESWSWGIASLLIGFETKWFLVVITTKIIVTHFRMYMYYYAVYAARARYKLPSKAPIR